MRQGLSNKANWAMVDKGNGIVAFDPKAGKFGVVLAADPAVFFTKKQVLSAEIPSGDPTLLRVSVNQSGGPWSRSLRFRSKEKAKRWLDHLMDRS
ncbi:hypothetical protein EON79_16270 [bacterium]|nr:MAG: hypothetical protein EON79_16270 [bacterium]